MTRAEARQGDMRSQGINRRRPNRMRCAPGTLLDRFAEIDEPIDRQAPPPKLIEELLAR